jgi:hypothetical protein
VKNESFKDVLLQPGDEEMVEQAVQAALDAGVTEQEVAEVFESEPRDVFWVPLVSGRLSYLARARRRGDVRPRERPLADLEQLRGAGDEV